jgi:Rieske Fe-S protein
MNRRKFIEQTCLACMAATAGVSLLGMSACSTTQVLKTASTNGIVLIDKASFLAEKEAKLIRVAELEHDILVLKEGNSFSAIYLQCTHQNNPVNYTGSGIVCNAHGSQFGLSGEVITGPASIPLKKIPISHQNNQLSLTIK